MEHAARTIAAAATTKLEYKLVKQILDNKDPMDAKSKMTSAEMSYSRMHRLRYQDHVHQAVLSHRQLVHKKAQRQKASKEMDAGSDLHDD